MRGRLLLLLLLLALISLLGQNKCFANNKIILAYVVQNQRHIPNPLLMTHIIYAFGEFNNDNDGIIIPDTIKLEAISKLKRINPKLSVILGIGGKKREGFSEMASDKYNRTKFIKSIDFILNKYQLDGVDLDWEFPTTEKGGHTARKDDDINYGLLVKELREYLGENKWISFYSNNSAAWIDFKRMLPYVDYVNVSGYNLNVPFKDKILHHSHLYPSETCGLWSVSNSIKRHIEKGVPPHKILLGLPFFGRSKYPFPTYVECNKFNHFFHENEIKWDDKAKAPYFADKEGNLVMGFDNEESISEKIKFLKRMGLSGIFYWNYDGDYNNNKLSEFIIKSMYSE